MKWESSLKIQQNPELSAQASSTKRNPTKYFFGDFLSAADFWQNI